LIHQARSPADGAVDERLDSAQAQAFAAKSGAKPESMDLVVGIIDREHVDAHREDPAAMSLPEESDISRLDEGIGQRRQAGGMKGALHFLKAAQAIFARTRRQQSLRARGRVRPEDLHRFFVQDAIEAAARVVLVLSAGWIRNGVVDPGQLERFRIDDAPMPGHVVDEDRMVATDLVEVPARQHATLGHLRVVVAAAAQPSARRSVRQICAKFFE
jgi:hypothetical protein